MSKYAFIERDENGGFAVSIGRDIPGLPSHGAASVVGVSPTFGEAVEVCLSRGVPTSRIQFGDSILDRMVREGSF